MENNFYTKTRNMVGIAVVCTLLWGSAYPSIKIGYQLFHITDVGGQMLFAGLRFTLAGLIVLAICWGGKRRAPVVPVKYAGELCTVGLVMTGMQYICFYIGLSHTSGVKGAVLAASSTFFSVLLSHFCYRNDRLNVAKVLGCVLGFAGVIVINMGGGGMNGAVSFQGEGLLLLSSLSFAVGQLLNKRATDHIDPGLVAGWQLTIGGVVLLLLGFVLGGSIAIPSAKGALLLLYMAGISSVGFSGWSQLLKYNPMGKVTIFNFLIPVFGVLMSSLFLNESIFNWRSLTALVLVCCGIVAVNRQKA